MPAFRSRIATTRSSVTLVTGHGGEGGREPDWRALAAERATVVFYMGLARLEHIVAKLIEHGAPPDRPAALIAQGTLPASASRSGNACEHRRRGAIARHRSRPRS